MNSIVEVASTVNSTAGPYMGWGGVVGAAAERALLASPGVDAATGVINGVKVVGKGLGWAGEILSLGVNGVALVQNPYLPSNWGRMGVSTGIALLNLVPAVGSTASFILSSIDASGGFDGFYKWLDDFF